MIRSVLLVGTICAALATVLAPAARADGSAEATLAARYAPVLRLVLQETPCGGGEPYSPIDVEAVLGNDQVAARGPWAGSNLVKVAPTGSDLAAGRTGYHLDFPGNALSPGCSYEQWQRQLDLTAVPTTYARVVSEDGQTAIEYWFFYIYNDFNNKHEGDWETIQIDFAAPDAAAALDTTPTEVGYSQHDGAERAAWGDSKLEKIDGTHPVVYPAEGSHANYYQPAVYLGSSAAEGVGCDNTQTPSREVRPIVALVPSDSTAMLHRYPWLGFLGHWGEQHPAFYDGPTGPNVHSQWNYPITWANTKWHPSAFVIPSGVKGVPRATSLFCTGVAGGSTLLTAAVRGGATVFLAVLAVLLIALWAAAHIDWRPSQPFHLARRRGLGQILAASARMYRHNPRLYLTIGALFLPCSFVMVALQRLLFAITNLDVLSQTAGATNAAVALVAMAVGVAFALIVLTIVQAMVASSIAHAEQATEFLPRTAYHAIVHRIRSLLAAMIVVAAAVYVVSLTAIGIPVAVWLLVRWSLFAQCIVLEGLGWRAALARSHALVRGHGWRVASITIAVVGVALLLGPAVGVVLLLTTPLSLSLVNIVSAVVYTLTVPYAAIATTFLYYDLRVREQTEHEPSILPAEAALQ